MLSLLYFVFFLFVLSEFRMGGSSSSFLKSTDKRVALVMQKRKHIPLFDGDEYSTYLRPYVCTFFSSSSILNHNTYKRQEHSKKPLRRFKNNVPMWLKQRYSRLRMHWVRRGRERERGRCCESCVNERGSFAFLLRGFVFFFCTLLKDISRALFPHSLVLILLILFFSLNE